MPTEIPLKLGGPAKPIILVPTLVNDKGPYQFALDNRAGLTVIG